MTEEKSRDRRAEAALEQIRVMSCGYFDREYVLSLFHAGEVEELESIAAHYEQIAIERH